jgi:hypothetical protein
MSSASNTATSSNFQALLNAALANYTKQTGRDLRNHPLADRIDSCDSPDSILDIFQEQVKAFDDSINGDTKMFKLLRPVVNVLHALSTNSVVSDNGSLVNPAFLIIYSMYLNSIHRCFLPQRRFFLLSGSSYPYASPWRDLLLLVTFGTARRPSM